MYLGYSEEWRASDGSFVKQLPGILTAMSTGTFVKSDTTSKDTRIVFGGRDCLELKSTNSIDIVCTLSHQMKEDGYQMLALRFDT